MQQGVRDRVDRDRRQRREHASRHRRALAERDRGVADDAIARARGVAGRAPVEQLGSQAVAARPRGAARAAGTGRTRREGRSRRSGRRGSRRRCGCRARSRRRAARSARDRSTRRSTSPGHPTPRRAPRRPPRRSRRRRRAGAPRTRRTCAGGTAGAPRGCVHRRGARRRSPTPGSAATMRARVDVDGDVAERRAQDVGARCARGRRAATRCAGPSRTTRRTVARAGAEPCVPARGDRTREHVAGVGDDDRLRNRRRRDGDGAAGAAASSASTVVARARGRGRGRSARPPPVPARVRRRTRHPPPIRTGRRRAPQVPAGPSKRPGSAVPHDRQRPSSVRW